MGAFDGMNLAMGIATGIYADYGLNGQEPTPQREATRNRTEPERPRRVTVTTQDGESFDITRYVTLPEPPSRAMLFDALLATLMTKPTRRHAIDWLEESGFTADVEASLTTEEQDRIIAVLEGLPTKGKSYAEHWRGKL